MTVEIQAERPITYVSAPTGFKVKGHQETDGSKLSNHLWIEKAIIGTGSLTNDEDLAFFYRTLDMEVPVLYC